MGKRIPAAVLLLLVAGCRQKPAPPTASAPPPPPPPNLARALEGTVVLDRSGEYALDNSAFLMLDSEPRTFWATPPGSDSSWAILRLAVPVRLRSAGISAAGPAAPQSLRFEGSRDGKEFVPLGTLQVKPSGERQLVSFAPAEVEFVRVTAQVRPTGNPVAVPTLELAGEELGRWTPPLLTGRWKINNLEAEFSQAGNRVSGVLGMRPPMVLQGGWDGRMIRFAWVRGPQFGYAVAGVSPDGRQLNGCYWFEKALPLFLSDNWFGTREQEASRLEPSFEVVEALLRRFGHAPLYGLAFDGSGSLDVAASASTLDEIVRIIAVNPERGFALRAYEFRRGTAEENLKVSRKAMVELQKALRGRAALSFEAKGTADPDAPQESELQRALYSRVDLAIVR